MTRSHRLEQDILGARHIALSLGSRVGTAAHLDNKDTAKGSVGVVVGDLDQAQTRDAVDGARALGTGWDLNGEVLEKMSLLAYLPSHIARHECLRSPC